jgi:hypothetical protein
MAERRSVRFRGIQQTRAHWRVIERYPLPRFWVSQRLKTGSCFFPQIVALSDEFRERVVG